MKSAVIIGAGPAGLYLAIKLYREGLRNIIIYDPRAGHYTRPGHLNADVFTRAQDGVKKKFWPQDESGHIKSLEKELYKIVLKLSIPIENKSFIKLYQDKDKIGIIVQDDRGEEIIETPYVFDCTGSKRIVINEVNTLIKESPLQIYNFTNLPVKNHFLAYVKMCNEDWLKFEKRSFKLEYHPDFLDAHHYTQSILKLRNLGWHEFKYPRSYGKRFDKNKVCLYIQAPENLTNENYDNWVQTALECFVPTIKFEKLPTNHKPRFLAFPSNAQVLRQVAYQGKNLPTVIAIGDAQIDSDYALAHGIYDGMSRIDKLFIHMDISDNQIQYFDCSKYMSTIKWQLGNHERAIIQAAKNTIFSFEEMLEVAKDNFEERLSSCTNEEKVIFQKILHEIELRNNFLRAKIIFNKHHDQDNQIKLTQVNFNHLMQTLSTVHTNFITTYQELSSNLREHHNCKDLLLPLAISWKQIGNFQFNARNLSEATTAYNNAVEIYQLPNFVDQRLAEQITLHSNRVIVYLQSKMYSDGIAAAEIGLSIYDRFEQKEKINTILEKLVVNYCKILCAKKDEQSEYNQEEIIILGNQANNLLSKYGSKLPSKSLQILQKSIEKLENLVDSSGSKKRKIDTTLDTNMNFRLFSQLPVNLSLNEKQIGKSEFPKLGYF